MVQCLGLGHGAREPVQQPVLLCTNFVQLLVNQFDHDLVRNQGSVLHLLGGPDSNLSAQGNVLAEQIAARDRVDLKVVLDPARLCSLAGALCHIEVV